MIGRHDTIERHVDGGGGWRMGRLGDRREGVPTDVDVEERRGPVSRYRAPSQLLTSLLVPLNNESDSCVFPLHRWH
jgi:hypothetical protein